ncbi:MAG TPA: hypothetical protein VKK31_03035 [Thermoanaerobaculia bacterium]|nr:hypothetical protein [Thermoanaerobaculia bacterium]
MSQARVLWHLMRADFLERVRRYSFLLTLGLAVYLGYVVSVGQLKLWIDDSRGIYNSPWVGVVMAMVINSFLSIAGFYVVKGSVERDRRTGVGQILATTPMSKPLYTLGKMASNLAVLLAMVAVLAVMAFAAQLVAGEDTRLQMVKLLAPILVFCVPVMAIVAAFAVLFETLPGLRGGLGNIAWFFLWVGLMPASILTKGSWDLLGLGAVSADLYRQTALRYGVTKHSFVLGAMADERGSKIFHWDGMDWTPEILLSRLVWLGLAVGLALIAAVFFDRFDTARSSGRVRKPQAALPEPAEAVAGPAPAIHLHPLPEGARRFRFFDLLRAELRLLLKGQRWWWYAVALGLLIASIAAPIQSVRSVVLPLAWLWPILLWSALGTREARFATDGLVFSAARPLGRQLPAVWLSGVLLAVATGGAAVLRFALAGDWTGVGAWTVGALFIPTLALTLGVWSGSSKLFEIIFLVFWYLGPMQRVPALDYVGAVPAAVKAGMPLAYLAATALLMAAAVAGRKRQLARL